MISAILCMCDGCSSLQVVLNPTISKKAKSLFFTRAVLVSLAQFLIQEEEDLQLVAEGDGPGGVHLPVLCFQLLIQLCTNFQTGVCYRSKWGQVTQRRCAYFSCIEAGSV